jgi:enoyl-CoA hydratase/carnithine racemase
MTSPLKIDRHGTIEIWTINLPEQRNPISSPEMADAFESAVSTAMSEDVRAIVLTGAGSAFSAGGNIKDMDQRKGLFGGTALEQRTAYRTGIQRIPRALLGCDIPLIAAINGPAIGVGFDLTMMCDLRIAARSAVMAESYVQLGIIPGGGGAWLLPRAIGAARAAELLFTGDRIDADAALQYGIVSRVVDDDELLDVARELASKIARNSPDAVRVAKRLMREGAQQSMPSHLEFAAALQPLLQGSANHREALSSFLERRSPVYPAAGQAGAD